jgi:predicted nucleic acid-binding protein
LTTLVLDASVAINWAVPSVQEPLTQQALNLFQHHLAGEIEFIVPDIFWAEMGNVLWKGIRQQRWRRDKAEAVAADLCTQDFQTVPSRILMPEALDIALTYSRNIYDCLYTALAVESRSDLITADERLANALAARFPVKWLGAL